MYSRASLDLIIKQMNKERKLIEGITYDPAIHGALESLDPTAINEADAGVGTPAPAVKLIDNLDELQEAIKDKTFPYELRYNGTSKSGFNIYLYVEGLDETDEGYTISIKDISYSNERLFVHEWNAERGFIKKYFKKDVAVKEDADVKSFKDIVKQCDANYIYTLYRKEAIKLLKQRMNVVNSFLEEVVQIRNPKVSTLGVCYDKRVAKFVMHYNPAFPLQAALQEYTIHPGKFSSLKEAYVYTLAFLYAHEMNHIMRHHTNKGDGLIEDINHQISNVIEDSFINIYLSKVFKGTFTSDSHILSSGIDGNMLISSISSPVANAITMQGFKEFGSLQSLVRAIGDAIARSCKIKDVNYGYSYQDADLSKYIGANYLLKVSCWDLSLFNGNSSIYTNTVSEIVRVVSGDKVKPKPKEKKPKESLIGKRIKDRRTGQIGVVVEEDTVKGTVKIALEDNTVKKFTEFANKISEATDVIIERPYRDVIVLIPKEEAGDDEGAEPDTELPDGVETEVEGDEEDDEDSQSNSQSSGSGSSQEEEQEEDSDSEQGSQSSGGGSQEEEEEKDEDLDSEEDSSGGGAGSEEEEEDNDLDSESDDSTGGATGSEEEDLDKDDLDSETDGLDSETDGSGAGSEEEEEDNDLDSDGEGTGDGEDLDSDDSFDDEDEDLDGNGDSDSDKEEDEDDFDGDSPFDKRDSNRNKPQRDDSEEDDEESSGGGGSSDKEEEDEDNTSSGGDSDDTDDKDSEEDEGDGSDASLSTKQDGDELGDEDDNDSDGDSGDMGDSNDEPFGDPNGDSSGEEDDGSDGSSGDMDNSQDNMGTEDETLEQKKSRIQELLDEIGKEKLDTQTDIEKEDEQKKEGTFGQDENSPAVPPQDRTATDDAEERKRLKDILDNAMKKQGKQEEGMSDEVNQLLNDGGLSKITSLFKPTNVGDWKVKIKMILDMALGLKDSWDSDTPNKRVEDAPPGAEVEEPEIEHVIIMLDCSSSMGSEKFLDAIEHLTNLFASYKMRDTKFHLVPWGADLNTILKQYTTVRGDQNVQKKLITYHGIWGRTDIGSAFGLVATKIPKPDMVMVLTDGEYNGMGGFEQVTKRYIAQNRNRIFWLFTKNHDEKPTLNLDPTAKSQKRFVVLGK